MNRSAEYRRMGGNRSHSYSTDNEYNRPKKMSRKQGVLIMLTTMTVLAAVAVAVVITLYCFKHKNHYHGIPKSSATAEMYQHAAVAADAVKCSEIGRDILQNRSGSAVDAAVAVSFCLGLYSMHSTGIGGGGMMLIYKRDTKTMESIDYRETAPGKSREDMFVDDDEKARVGGLSIAVPGEVKGMYEAHKKHGKLPWKDLVQPSIELAENGYPMPLRMFEAAEAVRSDLEKDAGMRKLLFKDGKVIDSGGIIVNQQLANTLKKIAKNPNDFYNGSLAEDIVKDIHDAGGIITLDDLANYKVKKDEIIVDELGEFTLHTLGAPTGGPIVTHILNILKGYGFRSADLKDNKKAIKTYHRIIEAFKFGYAQKTKEGDPAFLDKDKTNKWLQNMTSAAYGTEYRLKITDDETHNVTYYGAETELAIDHGTSHTSILDEDGNAVSMTSTINTWYGSCFRSLTTGILYNNEMDDFSTPDVITRFGYPPTASNFIKPNKRPVSSMAPFILTDHSGGVKIVLGASGGTKIITAAVQGLMYLTWFGDDLGTAVVRPRLHHQLFPNVIGGEINRALSKEVMDGLTKIGHDMKLEIRPEFSAIQAIYVEGPNKIYAKCDPRKYGHSAGY